MCATHRKAKTGNRVVPVLCSNWAAYNQLATYRSRQLLNIYKQGDSKISVKTLPVLCHPHSEKAFPEIQRETPVF